MASIPTAHLEIAAPSESGYWSAKVSNGEEQREVDCIVRSFTKGGTGQTLWYVVRWKGTQEITEENFEHLIGTADDAIADFHYLNPNAPGPPPTYKPPDGWIPPPTPKLLQLPTELLERIAHYCCILDDEALLRLRAVCRHIHLRIQLHWRLSYFQCRYVRLEMSKLREVYEVSRRRELASLVSKLVVQCSNSSDFETGVSDGTEEKRLLRLVLSNLKQVTEIQFTEGDDHLPEKTVLRAFDGTRDIVDYSTTFATFVEAVEGCDLTVTCVLSDHSSHQDKVDFGIGDFHALTQMSRAFANITELEFRVLLGFGHSGSDAEVTKRSNELAAGLTNLHNLEKLHVSFNYGNADSILAALGTMASLPRLHSVKLSNMVCTFDLIVRFMWSCSQTLRSITLSWVLLEDEDFADQLQNIRSFLDELGTSFDLTMLCLEDIDMGDLCLSFGGMCTVLVDDEVDGYGYIHVKTRPVQLLLEGENLRADVMRVGDCLTWIPQMDAADAMHDFPTIPG